MQLTALSLALTRIGLGGFGVGSSLNLDFTSGNQTLDPRITFSRASNATVTGPDGVLQYAPHNLLRFSEQFDVTTGAWSISEGTISANSAPAPDSTRTADKFVENTATSALHRVIIGVTHDAGISYSLSVHAKADGRRWIRLSNASDNQFAYFDLQDGVVGTVSAGVTANIVQAAQGFYRCAITYTPLTTALKTIGFNAAAVDNSATYTGDGVSGIFLWGAQLNVGSLQPYYPTTVKNLLGFTQEFDNAAWTKSNSFVQTNLLTFSEQFDNAAWLKVRSSITQNAATAPDGAATADKLVIDTTAATNHNTGQNVTVVSGATYTLSVYVKAAEFSQINLRFSAQFPAGNTTFDLSTETKTNLGTVVDSSIDPVGGGWYRCTFTQTANASGTATAQVFLAQGWSITIATANGTDGIYLWGAQLVQGSTPGDYQRTEGTARAVMYPAPDGSRTADKLVEDAASAIHYTRPAASVSVVSGTLLTTSVYAKAGERSKLGLFPYNSAAGARFDLTNGTVISQESGVTASITPLGGGWFRCAASIAAPAGSATPWITVVNPSSATNYTGDGTSGIYIWGAQLSDSASLDPYVYNPGAAPAAAAYYGPRFDYDPVTLQPKGLLIEEQRTNLLLDSSLLLTGWTRASAASFADNAAIAPDGTLTATGVSGLFGVTLSFSASSLYRTGTSIAPNTTYTLSFYVRAQVGEVSNLVLRIAEVGGSANNTVSPAFSATTEWKRISLTVTSNSGATGASVLLGTVSGAANIFVWGAQLEAGAFPTSYIPTTTAAATRAADVAVMQGANFSNWYRQDEGTLFVEFDKSNNAIGARVATISNGTANNQVRINATVAASIRPDWQILDGGAVQVNITNAGLVSIDAVVKSAGTYQANDFAFATNGTSGTTDTAGTVPSVTQFNIGANEGAGSLLNGHIRKIAYFPRRLSNAELQGITS